MQNAWMRAFYEYMPPFLHLHAPNGKLGVCVYLITRRRIRASFACACGVFVASRSLTGVPIVLVNKLGFIGKLVLSFACVRFRRVHPGLRRRLDFAHWWRQSP